MHRRSKHFRELFAATMASGPTWTAADAVLLNPRCLSIPRASWEVCPKHRNIRREFQRVRSHRARLRRFGKGFCSYKPAQPRRPSVAEAIAPRSPGGGFCRAVIFLFMKPDNNPHEGKLRAAVYVRMSTDHQRYSTENQSDAMREYAARRGIEIIETLSLIHI